MSESADLMEMIVRTFESVSAMGDAQQRFDTATMEEIGRLWKDNAELRDELHAVANRVETLTRAVMADPAEVAQAIVNDANRSLLFECERHDCYMREPHIHDHYDGHIIVGAERVNRRLT